VVAGIFIENSQFPIKNILTQDRADQRRFAGAVLPDQSNAVTPFDG
jgi:hypothetical protein